MAQKILTINSGGNTQEIDALTDNVNFAGFKAIAMACDNGTSFPASPQTGQWFYRTDIKTLFVYEADWKPIISYGAINMYVDPSLGTDDLAGGKGFASGSSAFATLQYAWNCIPPVFGGNVTIYVKGTMAEALSFRGKQPTGPYAVTIDAPIADMTESLAETTATGGAKAVYGTSKSNVVKTGEGWTTNAYQRKFCYFTSGSNNGTMLPIQSNTADTLALAGDLTANPASGDTFKILTPTAIITSLGTAPPFDCVNFYRVWIEGSSSVVAANLVDSRAVNFYNCILGRSDGTTGQGCRGNYGCSVVLTNCITYATSRGVAALYGAFMISYRGLHQVAGNTGDKSALYCQQGSILTVNNATILDGIAKNSGSRGFNSQYNNSGMVANSFIENTDIGILVNLAGGCLSSVNLFTNCNTNTSATNGGTIA